MKATLPSASTAPSALYRWAVLFVISLAMFGNYYVYDSIAPIADLLKDGLGINDQQYGLLYTAYSIAAVLFLLVGGVLVDRIGTAKSAVIFGALCTVSGILMAATSNYVVMLVARFMLGVGAEVLIVAITTALAKWFKGKELGFAMGINLTIARLGQIAVDNSPTWAAPYFDSFRGPLVIAAVIGLSCTVFSLGYWAMEASAKRRYTLGQAGESDKLVVADLFKFDRTFWIITALCVTFYTGIFPFRAFAPKYFMEAHGASREYAGMLQSALPFAAMVATPLIGLLVDVIGRRALLMFAGAILMAPVFLLLTYTNLPIFIPVAMLGASFSVIPAIMWPSVAYIVDERRLGTAYAMMAVVQQVGVAAMTWLIGASNDAMAAGPGNPDGYALGMWIFSGLGILALLFAYLLRRAETGPKAHGLETIKAY